MRAVTRTARDLEHLRLARVAAADGTAKRLREMHEATLGEVGGVVGATAAAVWYWENGRRRPSGRPALVYGRLIASWMADAEAPASVAS